MGRILGILAAGLVGVLIVGAIAFYGLDGIGKIEAGLQRSADRSLEETGPPWARVEVRGRDAVLEGEALLPEERRQAAERAARAIDAIPGIREVRDNTTARFRSMAEIEARLAEICKRAAADLPTPWLDCAVEGNRVTLSGVALTEAARKTGVDRVSTSVEGLRSRETIRDTTLAHYRSPEGLRRAFAGACNAAITGFTLNWMRCSVAGRKFTLSGAAPVEAERETRVAAASAMLKTVRGVEGVADETTAMPVLASAEACRETIDGLTKDRPIRFAAGAAAITPEIEPLLGALTMAAKRCIGVRIEVRGHADDSGDAEGGRKLSAARAKAVVAYMTGLGVPAGRMSARGDGGTKPRVAGDTEAGRAKDRRIEFAIQPESEPQ